MSGIIYKATNKINGKIYIGQTWKKLKDRIREHCCLPNCRLFHNAIKKHKLENFVWDILEKENIQENLDELEKYYINEFNSRNRKFGYNLKEGGSHGKHSKETKIKMSLLQKKRFEDIEVRIKHSKAHNGKEFWGKREDIILKFDIQREASKKLGISRSKIGEVLNKKFLTTKGWFFSYDKKEVEDFVNPNGFYAKKFDTILYFDNYLDAAEYIKCSPVNISSIFRGKQKTVNGWSFSKNKIFDDNYKIKPFYAIKDNVAKEFKSMLEASKVIKINKATIRKILQGKKESFLGWKFSYNCPEEISI